MSYILDALRKSEHERRMREAPVLASVPADRHVVSRRPSWYWPVVLLTLLNVLALVLWAWFGKDSSEDKPIEMLPDARQQPRLQQPVPAMSESESESARDIPVSAADPVSGQQSATRKAAPLDAQIKAAPPASIADWLPEQQRATESVVSRRPVLKPESEAQAVQSTAVKPEGRRNRSADSVPKPDDLVPAAVKSTRPIPYLRELPRDFQRRVPTLKMNIHMYADEPQHSFAIINMVKYRPGQFITEGLLLRRITPTGLVLRFENRLFQLGQP